MENEKTPAGKETTKGFAGFAAKRILLVAITAVVGLWIVIKVIGLFGNFSSPESDRQARAELQTQGPVTGQDTKETAAFYESTLPSAQNPASSDPAMGPAIPAREPDMPVSPMDNLPKDSPMATTMPMQSPPAHQPAPTASRAPAADGHVKKAPEETGGHRPFQNTVSEKPKGVAFVEALIAPLEYELTDRFWGWRPNDIINLTDNVNNMQLGILEFSRRTAIVLVERISRTGATAAFDLHLQQAMNWFMIKAEQYWLPSPEDKYKEGLKELKEYKRKLEAGQANFYTRNDNLIPLLAVYEDLLGSCEENLVKQSDENGDPISFFMADDYFYYAKGVATAMLPVLEAISVDFAATIEARRGTDVLHHAIEALHHAVAINPFIITNSDLDGILANHRANMAAPISHARFYLGVLIKTLST